MRALLDFFRPGTTVHLPGATGELLALNDALTAEPDRMRGVTVLSCLLPGINTFDHTALSRTAVVTTFLLPSALRGGFAAGKVRLLPLTYAGIAAHLREQAAIDVAVAHVAPPDAAGRCSFGIAADFSPIAWTRARRRVAVINRAMPIIRRGPTIALAEADAVIECHSPLLALAAPRPTPAAAAIANYVASLIPDGATLQFGIGVTPAAVCGALTSHRDLAIRSGIAIEGTRRMADAGALAPADRHQAGIAGGSRNFYEWLGDSDQMAFADTRETHDIAALGALDRFHAINGALEVDLTGQVNCAWRGGRVAGGVGGAPDFVHAAARSRGGRAIITLAATADAGTASRMVPRLDTPAVSLTTTDADTVVTEHGVAELRGRSFDERAAALIAVADPAFRDELARAWREQRSKW